MFVLHFFSRAFLEVGIPPFFRSWRKKKNAKATEIKGRQKTRQRGVKDPRVDKKML